VEGITGACDEYEEEDGNLLPELNKALQWFLFLFTTI